MNITRCTICAVLLAIVLAMPATMAAGTIFLTTLSGANEVPPTGSPAIGSSIVTLTGNTLSVTESFSGLTVPATAAHIHCCAPVGTNAPVAVPFTAFPNMTSGVYTASFDLTLAATYTSTFVTASGGTAALAEASLIAALNAGQTYANIHDPTFPGGEIRGQLAGVPEPSTAGLLLLGLIPLMAAVRKSARVM